MDEYRKAAGGSGSGSGRCRLLLSALAAQLQAPASFSLTRDLPNEAVLLTDQTTVTLKNIEISSKLFFVLLRKTKITVGKRFSISRHDEKEDCIREHGMARNTPFCLERPEAVSSLALENIKRMPPNNIGCILKRVDLSSTWLINILPKLRIKKDCEVGDLTLNTNREEHVAGILKHDQMFCVGRVKRMNLNEYAVGVITKVNLKDCEIEWLGLHASEEAHVSAVLEYAQTSCDGRLKNVSFMGCCAVQEQKFCVGRVENMSLGGYAVCVVTKMRIKKGNIMENLFLDACGEQLSRILEKGDGSIELGQIRTGGLDSIPEEIKRKLRYTLVDGEGRSWVLMRIYTDEKGNEVLISIEREIVTVCKGVSPSVKDVPVCKGCPSL
ncbi:MAG: uncharacterized protein A8A55_1480 [Amphiamblys sp. WSBS2006]|nr:MAG: uncharacterized protein A8A55_1480 [Amphiamblys sp. WSBS2006]